MELSLTSIVTLILFGLLPLASVILLTVFGFMYLSESYIFKKRDLYALVGIHFGMAVVIFAHQILIIGFSKHVYDITTIKELLMLYAPLLIALLIFVLVLAFCSKRYRYKKSVHRLIDMSHFFSLYGFLLLTPALFQLFQIFYGAA